LLRGDSDIVWDSRFSGENVRLVDSEAVGAVRMGNREE
jgi:hypothetical protein